MHSNYTTKDKGFYTILLAKCVTDIMETYFSESEHSLLWTNNASFDHYEVFVDCTIVRESTLLDTIQQFS